MKTTLEIEDDLFIATKAAAAQRRTTIRAIVEHALRREVIGKEEEQTSAERARCYEIGEFGLPRLKRTQPSTIGSEDIYQIMEEEGI